MGGGLYIAAFIPIDIMKSVSYLASTFMSPTLVNNSDDALTDFFFFLSITITCVCVCVWRCWFSNYCGKRSYISHFDWQREKDGGHLMVAQQFGNDEILFSLKEGKKTSRRHPGV